MLYLCVFDRTTLRTDTRGGAEDRSPTTRVGGGGDDVFSTLMQWAVCDEDCFIVIVVMTTQTESVHAMRQCSPVKGEVFTLTFLRVSNRQSYCEILL